MRFRKIYCGKLNAFLSYHWRLVCHRIQNYKLKSQNCKKKAEAARANELAEAKAKISEIMKKFGLTVADLGGQPRAKSYKVREPVAIKYKDPETGATWTGRGRSPVWLNGKNKEDYFV